MGLYFRKSVTIVPGVRLNMSKKGMSVSAGPKGAKVNISKRGTYLTTSVPGTGVYSRQKISGMKSGTTLNHKTLTVNKFSEGTGIVFGALIFGLTALFIYWTFKSFASGYWFLGILLALVSIVGIVLGIGYIVSAREEIKAKKQREIEQKDIANSVEEPEVADVANDIWTPQEAQRYNDLLIELNEHCEQMDKADNINDLNIHYYKALSIFAEFEKTTLQLNDVSVPEAKQQLIDAYEEYKSKLNN